MATPLVFGNPTGIGSLSQPIQMAEISPAITVPSVAVVPQRTILPNPALGSENPIRMTPLSPQGIARPVSPVRVASIESVRNAPQDIPTRLPGDNASGGIVTTRGISVAELPVKFTPEQQAFLHGTAPLPARPISPVRTRALSPTRAQMAELGRATIPPASINSMAEPVRAVGFRPSVVEREGMIDRTLTGYPANIPRPTTAGGPRPGPDDTAFETFTKNFARLIDTELTTPGEGYTGDVTALGWSNQRAIDEAQQMRRLFGRDPDMTATGRGGHAVWKDLQTKNGKYKVVKVMDGYTLHYFPHPHLEIVKVGVEIHVDGDLRKLSKVSKALNYDSVGHILWVSAGCWKEALLLLFAGRAYMDGLEAKEAARLVYILWERRGDAFTDLVEKYVFSE